MEHKMQRVSAHTHNAELSLYNDKFLKVVLSVGLYLTTFYGLLLYISGSIWVLSTPNVGQNLLFHCFFAKKQRKKKKQENLGKIYQKICF